MRGLVYFLVLSCLLTAVVRAEFIVLQSTTSTQNSGLYDSLLPVFRASTGIAVRVVAVGTGQALRNAANGDADVVIVHAKEAELEFLSQGHGLYRRKLMYNDYVIIGPKSDPLELSLSRSTEEAVEKLRKGDSVFVSRGDDSGTHKHELKLWAGQPPMASIYRETGSGMGSTLRTAIEMQAYTLSDRGTWISYANKSDAKIVFEAQPQLFNQYSVLAINPAIHPNTKVAAANKFIDWILGPIGQAEINRYRLNQQQLFFANAD